MGLTDGQEQTKIDKFKSIVVKKVYRKIRLLMTNVIRIVRLTARRIIILICELKG